MIVYDKSKNSNHVGRHRSSPLRRDSHPSRQFLEVGEGGLTDEQLKIYSTVGGTPHLDGQYTVFGEVEDGLDVVEMIQGTATGRADRPVDDIEMRMTVIK